MSRGLPSRLKQLCRSKRLAAVALFAGFVAWGWFDGLARIVNWQARGALSAYQPVRARDVLLRAERWTHNNAESQFLLARASRRLGQFDDTRTHLQRAWDLGFPVERLEREQWLAYAASGQLQEAEPHFSELFTDPRGDGDEICDAFATGFLMAYRLQETNRVLDVWEADYPGDPRPHFLRGRMFNISNDWVHAEEAFRKAVAANPQFASAVTALGDVLITQNQPEEALTWFQRVDRDPLERIHALIGQAKCRTMQGLADQARNLVSSVLAENPENPDALLQMGQLELDSGHYSAALDLLERAAKHNPRNAELLYARAAALRNLGRIDESRTLLDFITETRRSGARVERLVEEILAGNDSAEKRYEIGMHQLRYADAISGLMWLKSALYLDPNHSEARTAITEYEARRPSNSGE